MFSWKNSPSKNIQPIAKPAAKNIQSNTSVPPVTIDRPSVESGAAKLIIETKAETPPTKTEPVTQQIEPTPAPTGNTKPKLGTLSALRQKIQQETAGDGTATDQPLEMEALKIAWAKYIEQLKGSKNPAWQSFEVANLVIKDANSFEAVVNNNINHKFLEFERNSVSGFLQKELRNRQLKFSITIIEGQQEKQEVDRPLSSKEQYQKIIEQYPLVKELKDRLRLELDY